MFSGRLTVGDEPRKLIAICLYAKVLGWLRKTAKKKGLPLLNEILASEMRKASLAAEEIQKFIWQMAGGRAAISVDHAQGCTEITRS